MTAEHADALILFGITGDLAYKKLVPALYHLVEKGKVVGPIVGVASTDMAMQALQDRIVASLADDGITTDSSVLNDLFGRLHYVSGDYREPTTLDQVAELSRRLADAGFVLPPEFDWLAIRARREAGGNQVGKVFLCASWTAGSCAGCCGRTETRRKPSPRSSLPTVRSATMTPQSASMARARSIRRHRTTPCVATFGPVRTRAAKCSLCASFRRGLPPPP